ncbi:hypothetical protein Rhe02_70380 [Rhizocola hellebori]|uniref:Uncharacterized protein n=1 Tax=Rhizocola hellebori TaxID=1392758 RepID=A0A8J3QDZ4_9ACTN|nr:hypothetical protein Rhe02_70380 [Rhizocola hellebori]
MLADYVGGALDGTPEADRVAQLIASSPQWRSAADELTAALRAVSDDLGVLREAPEIMPPDLVTRFDELLASPAMAPTAARPAMDPLAARRPTRSTKQAKRLRKWAVPVAMLSVVFGFLAFANLFPPTATRNESPLSARDEAGAAEMTDAKALPVPTVTSGKHHNRSSLGGSTRMTSESVPPATTSKTDSASPSPGMGINGGIPPELMRLTDPVALQRCLDAIATVLPGIATLIDYAYFETQPALVISITSIGGKWTFVAGPGCGIKGPDEIFRTPHQ